MNRPGRATDAGLTLVEVLVALALFSLIGLSGFAMLDNILRVRAGTEARLERLAEIDTALTLFSRDLHQSDPQTLIKDQQRLAMVRFGTGPLAWLPVDGALVRRQVASGFDQQIVGDVSTMAVRVLDSAGTWHDTWPQPRTGAIGLPPSLRAVELRLELPEGAITRLIDMPTEPGR